MVNLPAGIDANAMNGRPDLSNAVSETGSGFALDLNFLLKGVDYLLGGIVNLFVHGSGLLAGAVSALSQKSLEGSGADPQKFAPEVGLGIEFCFEPACELVQGAPELVPDVFNIGELHGDRDGVDRMALAQFLLSAQGNVGSALRERRDLIVTEIDISFRKDDEGVLASNENIGCALHRFSVTSLPVDAEGASALHNPRLDPAPSENIVGRHE